MTKKIFTLFLLLNCFANIFSQKKTLSVSDIYKGKFYAKSVGEIRPMNNGKHFSSLKNLHNGLFELEVFDYKNFEKQYSITQSPYYDYQFSNDQKKILFGGDFNKIYRHSKAGKYIIYDIETQKTTPIFEDKIQEPLFSSDGNKIAFAYKNNLYVFDYQLNKTEQITTDGEKNKIINGISDWVYEEEFGSVRQFDWSKNGNFLAFIRFDESQVPEFSMDIYGNGLYPTQQVFKYPKVGENNSKVELWVYNFAEKKKEKISSDAYYIPHLQWNNENSVLFYELNRHQNDFKIISYNILKKERKILYSEKSNSYVDIEMTKLHLLADNSFFITSEKDGFNHIYRYDSHGKLIKQVTKGNWQVTDFYGFNPKNKTIYYQSTERNSVQRDVYSISVNGKNKKLLSPEKGTNKAEFSKDFSYFINYHQSSTEPPSVAVFKTDNQQKIKELVNNNHLKDLVNSHSKTRKEFQQIEINSNLLNMWILKPEDFNPEKKYPVLMYQYSGPGSQSVTDKWFSYDDYWYLSLTQKGYIVVCVDGRGTGYKGADFKKVTYLQLGKYETEDQIKTAEYLASLPYIDASRIGIWGWSFGGFTSTNALLKGSHIFKMAIAVAPVTNWRFYDTIYTERFMRTPQENPSGYDENSPLNFANNLKGKYLLIHGTADDNVHIQNAMRMTEELIQKNKDFEWAVYPDKNHSIYGGYTRIHLFEKITNFILNNL